MSKKISQLTEVSTNSTSDVFVCNQSGDTKKTTLQKIADAIFGAKDAGSLPLGSSAPSGSTAEAIYKTKYHAGDEISLTNVFPGYLSSSAKRVRFTIPLDKPIGGDITGINFSNTGDITLYGATSNDTVTTNANNWSYSLARSGLFLQHDASTASSLPNGSACNVYFATSNAKITFT